MQTGKRRCTRCQSFKPLDEFYRRRGGLVSNCRSCLSFQARQRNVRLANDPKVREQRRAQKHRWHARQHLKRADRLRTRADSCAHLVYRLGLVPTCVGCGRFLPQSNSSQELPIC